MSIKKNISTQILAFAIGLQVFNISLNQNDMLLGKMGNGFTYINEIETVVEFIAEFVITGKDVIPETQVPGGSLTFEEEEKHLSFTVMSFKPHYYINYDLTQSPYWFNVKDYHLEINSPPPRA
ncbi:MAG: hypothetical protein ABJH05_02360 [Fulvivirga sp.]